jgi:hypothetical protein
MDVAQKVWRNDGEYVKMKILLKGFQRSRLLPSLPRQLEGAGTV